MPLRNVLLAVGALALLAGLTLVAFWLMRPHAPEQAAKVPSAAILVAARPIAAGTLLRSEDLSWKEIKPEAIAPNNIARDPAAPASEMPYGGAVTRSDFAAGEALDPAALVKASDRGFLAAVLSPGARAVSIAVDAPQSAAGLALPGDRVDLILTQSFGPEIADTQRKAVGETVLTDVRVIAVDQLLSGVPKPNVVEQRVASADTSHGPRTVTLEVSEREAERVLVAVQLGKVQLSVRALAGSGALQAQADLAPIWAADVSPALRELGRRSQASEASLPARGPVRQTRDAAQPASAITTPASRATIEVMHGSKTAEVH
jgi:pilus assembly protein CpaB